MDQSTSMASPRPLRKSNDGTPKLVISPHVGPVVPTRYTQTLIPTKKRERPFEECDNATEAAAPDDMSMRPTAPIRSRLQQTALALVPIVSHASDTDMTDSDPEVSVIGEAGVKSKTSDVKTRLTFRVVPQQSTDPSQYDEIPDPILSGDNETLQSATNANTAAQSSSTSSSLVQTILVPKLKPKCKPEVVVADECVTKGAATHINDETPGVGYRVFTPYVHTAEDLQAIADEVPLEYMPPSAMKKDIKQPKKKRKPWRKVAPTPEEAIALEALEQGTDEWLAGREPQAGCSAIGTYFGLMQRTRKKQWEIDTGRARPKHLEWEETYCFGEDTRILTDHGFLFLDEIEALLLLNETIQYACFDVKTESLLYGPGRLVTPPNKAKELLSFTSPGEVRRWDAGSGEYGRGLLTDDSNCTNHLSIRVTAEHMMYVQTGKLSRWDGGSKSSWTRIGANGKGGVAPPRKIRAADLSATNATSGLHIRFTAGARNGVHHAPSDATQDAALSYEFAHRLDLRTHQQVVAFLELYGFWLGDGSLGFNHAGGNGFVGFSQVKGTDVAWLQTQLPKCGLVEGHDYTWGKKSAAGQIPVRIRNARWFQYFNEEYGAKYQGSAYHDESLERIKSAKWLWRWVTKVLNPAQCRLIIAGLRRADGSSRQGDKVLYTSSVSFRDEIIVLLIHAGFTAYFELQCERGSFQGGERRIQATRDAWRVCWADTKTANGVRAFQPSMACGDVKVEKYNGRTWCVEVDHHDHLIVVQRAYRNPCDFVADADGHMLRSVVTKASRPIIIQNCMVRGHYWEDTARRVWAHVVKPKGGKIDERGIIINEDRPLLHCSPDGIYEASEVAFHVWMLDDIGKPILVEIKNPLAEVYLCKEPKPKWKTATTSKVATEATLPTPPKNFDESKGEHYSTHIEYAFQVQMQMEATLKRLGARVCDFVPMWKFDDLVGPKYDAETGRFLIARLHGTRYYYNSEFIELTYQEIEEFAAYCERDECPPEVEKSEMLAKFPALKVLSLAEVKVWLEPRKDENGKYIYGGYTAKGIPLPEIEMGEYEGKQYPKRLIGTRRCDGVIIPKSEPRYITLKEIAQHHLDTPAQKAKQEAARQAKMLAAAKANKEANEAAAVAATTANAQNRESC